MSQLLSTTQAAERLGVKPSRVRQLCLAKEFPGAQKIGRDWLIPERDVDAYRPTPPEIRRFGRRKPQAG